MKALPISVYRRNTTADCTNGGISSKYDELLLLCENGFVEVDENNLPENAVKVVKRHLFGTTVVHIQPCKEATGVGYMFGGNYAGTSNSRFEEMTGFYGAVAIHDRDESQEMYDRLTND